MKKRKTREEKIRLQLKRLKERLEEKEVGSVGNVEDVGLVAKGNLVGNVGNLKYTIPTSETIQHPTRVEVSTRSDNYSYVFSDLKRTALLFLLAIGLLAISYLTTESGYGSVVLQILKRT